jgi:hypothetical protein
MAASKTAIESFSFDGETVGASGAAALRRLPRLSEITPPGRMFDAIASMADLAEQSALEFEAAGNDEFEDATENHLQQGMQLAQRLRNAFGAETPVTLPAFIRRR